MFNLINSTWLFAIAAISIPVLIHLWNIRPGKTLKVGSIALIEASSRKNSRSFNLMDILLLLLRCLLLIVLAILLAQPFWSKLVNKDKLKGWVLIPKQNIHQVYQQFKPRVDSLTKAGYELHYFNTGFNKIDTVSFKNRADSGHNPIQNWALLKQLSGQVPTTLPLYVFTTNAGNSINGVKPSLALNLHIQTYTPADSTATWIQNAALVSTGGAVKITAGNSKPSGTTFTITTVQATEQRNSAFQMNVDNGKPTVSLKTDSASKFAVIDTTTLQIAIFTDKSNNDASYLNAALSSIKQFTNRKMQVRIFNNATQIPGGQNWIFWLSEQPVPASLPVKTSHLFKYEPGKVKDIHSWINAPGIEKIALLKHIPSTTKNDEVLWADGFGQPVLSTNTDGKVYSFYSRFNPAWSDLVWSDAFPKVMLNLLMQSAIDPDYDRRIIDDQQLQPAIIAADNTLTPNKLVNKTDLTKAFWLTLVFIFLIERWLAHRNKSTENYG